MVENDLSKFFSIFAMKVLKPTSKVKLFLFMQKKIRNSEEINLTQPLYRSLP